MAEPTGTPPVRVPASAAGSLPLARQALLSAWSALQRGPAAAAAWVSDPRSAAMVQRLRELRRRET